MLQERKNLAMSAGKKPETKAGVPLILYWSYPAVLAGPSSLIFFPAKFGSCRQDAGDAGVYAARLASVAPEEGTLQVCYSSSLRQSTGAPTWTSYRFLPLKLVEPLA